MSVSKAVSTVEVMCVSPHVLGGALLAPALVEASTNAAKTIFPPSDFSRPAVLHSRHGISERGSLAHRRPAEGVARLHHGHRAPPAPARPRAARGAQHLLQRV